MNQEATDTLPSLKHISPRHCISSLWIRPQPGHCVFQTEVRIPAFGYISATTQQHYI